MTMKRILYVLHSGVTGGTFLTNKDLMRNVQKDYEIYLLTAEYNDLKIYRYYENELKFIRRYPRHLNINVPVNDSDVDFHIWNAEEFHNSWFTFIYFDILTRFDIDIVHIRHLINHTFDLPQVAKKLGIPVMLSMHDFYFICPFYVLLDENQQYCAGKCSDNRENCYCPMNSLENINSKEIILQWRKNVLKMFSYVDYFVTTSKIVKKLFLDIYSDRSIINSENFRVIEHGRDFPKLDKNYFEIPSFKKPVKILCPANNLNAMKGSHLIKEMKRVDKDNLIEFHFLGNCFDDIEEYGIAHGTYERDDFYKKVAEIKPSFIGIFSIWPETFCHTLTEAWSCGIPAIGTNIGVIEDRIIKNNGGWIIDRDNPKTIFSLLEDIIKNEKYMEMVDNVSKISLKDTNAMAQEYIEIYELMLSE